MLARSLLLALAAMVMSISAEEASDVVTLTDSTFHGVVKDTQYVLAEFYAPWCGHCKTLAPEYEVAATKLKGEANIVLAKIDATEEKKVAEEFGVTGFPTLKWFVNGKPVEYTGGRTADTIVSWIKKKTGPAVTELKTAEALEAFKAANEVCAILSSSTPSEAFETAAKAMEIPFAMVGSEDLRKLVGVSSAAPTLVIFKPFDEGRVEAPLGTSEEIQALVEAHSLPLVIEFSQKTAQKIFGGSIKQHFLIFVDKEKAEEKTAVTAIASGVAGAYRGKYLFVSVDKADSRVVDFFGIKDFPNARIVEMGEKGMKKYKLASPDVTEASLKATLLAHAAGTLELDLKSEEPPASNDEDVKVIVGKTFKDIVKQPGKDVFVEFYAPWCGHCKSLAPKYDELGAWGKDKAGLVIAKMDASSNEVEGVDVSSFPTLKLFKADSDEIVDFSGKRELEDMIAFLEKEASSCSAPA